MEVKKFFMSQESRSVAVNIEWLEVSDMCRIAVGCDKLVGEELVSDSFADHEATYYLHGYHILMKKKKKKKEEHVQLCVTQQHQFLEGGGGFKK